MKMKFIRPLLFGLLFFSGTADLAAKSDVANDDTTGMVEPDAAKRCRLSELP